MFWAPLQVIRITPEISNAVQVWSLTRFLSDVAGLTEKALIICSFHVVFQDRGNEMLPNGEANLNNHSHQEDEGDANAGADTFQQN